MNRREWCLGVLGATGTSLARIGVQTAGRAHRYLHYDVFTHSALTGNQLAVFTDPAGLSTDDMARATREITFSSGPFSFPAEGAGTDIRLRIFGPDGEMPFAGHPVIGSTFALAQEGPVKANQGRVIFGPGAAPTPAVPK